MDLELDQTYISNVNLNIISAKILSVFMSQKSRSIDKGYIHYYMSVCL